MSNALPIGLFDSGVGGLTVYRALRQLMPYEDLIYFGDSAHLPYGIKDKTLIETYTIAATRLLLSKKIKFLLVACNTVSAQAMEKLHVVLPDLPACGVIAAGAEAAVKASKNGHIAVLATEGTVRSLMYEEMICHLRPDARVEMLACSKMVLLAEEGRFNGAEAEAIVQHYLSQLKPGYDTLVLGCTHFPLLRPLIEKNLRRGVTVIDSADATAKSVATLLKARAMLNDDTALGRDLFYVSSKPGHFARLGTQFLGFDITGKVEFEKAV